MQSVHRYMTHNIHT